jgi:hypothetical protein
MMQSNSLLGIVFLKDRYHDLVVPTDSALAVGLSEPPLICSHGHYFKDPTVQKVIQEFLAGSAVAGAAVPDTAPPPDKPLSDLEVKRGKHAKPEEPAG